MRRESPFLAGIVRACDKIAGYIVGGKDSFMASDLIQDAVLRNLVIVGEAAKNLSPGLRARAHDVPWRQITGMRDKLIHQYFGVNLERVWETAHVLPTFRVRVAELLSEFEGEDVLD